jgi:hypothetical protein
MGTQTILTEMVEKDKFSLNELPSCKTIERYLKNLAMSQVYEKHRPLSTDKRLNRKFLNVGKWMLKVVYMFKVLVWHSLIRAIIPL